MLSSDSIKLKYEKCLKFLKTRRFLIILATCVFLILLAFLMYVLGKSHTVYVDNSKTEQYQALRYAMVKLDNQEELETYPGVRDSFTVVRGKHTIRVTLEDDTVIERKFKIPLKSRAVILNLPSLVNNPDDQSAYLKDFVIQRVETEEDSTDSSGDGMSLDGSFEM